jgi:hypothetical protein
MWTLVVMLHAVSPNVPSARGSISFVTQGYEECRQARDTIVRAWESDRYRVTANCIRISR